MRKAASDLFERYHVKAYRYFLRTVGSHDVAEDLTQELFLRVVRHVRSCSPGREVAWMFRIARNLVVDYRREHPERPVPFVEAFGGRTEATQLVAFGLSEALSLLADSDREVFLLREVTGLDYEELAEACDTNPQAVRLRVSRARGRLKALLSRRLSADENKRRNHDG